MTRLQRRGNLQRRANEGVKLNGVTGNEFDNTSGISYATKMRVSESCSGVDGYGLLANNTFIVTDMSTREVSVELKLQDSKTKLDRWINIAGKTLGSHVDVAGPRASTAATGAATA